MKVGGTKGPNSTSNTKKTSKSSGDAHVDFSQYVRGGASETSGAAATQSIAQLDALLAVQESEDPTKKAARQRARVRSEKILEKLDQIRLRMLGGDLTVGHMIDVADVVASHRDKIDDPKLTAIMDEIDLRAQVELAKMRVALDQRR
ncbi:MAG: flagellar assembly protein FliX [Alphaproteobacteria bacterium]|nr:flagellar assembly protein FliX [Alphaproteobacteria bacterium]